MTLVSSLKKAYFTEKPVLVFILKLIILSCVWKTLFFVFNSRILNLSAISIAEALSVLFWAILYEVFIIVLINIVFILLLNIKAVRSSILKKMIVLFSALINSMNLLLNSADIFYYRFHLQRADIDLLYVLMNPFENASGVYVVMVVLILALFIISAMIFYRWMMRINRTVQSSLLVTFLFIAFLVPFILTGPSKILPSYPLTFLKSTELPLVQNSLHNFIYSAYRRNEIQIPEAGYMPEGKRIQLVDYRVKQATNEKRNVLLFIMESIPEDYFNAKGAHKVKMPFLDSLLRHSTYFSNAFSYSHNSNKGIVAMLGGIPTLTDLPLYHSKYISIPVSGAGSVLRKYNYETSFFIGDHHDDFGFAKCTNWLGFDHYYSMESIPNYKKLEMHPMGLHDEHVLSFMGKKLSETSKPFFAVNFNISTHYPNSLPGTYRNEYPEINKSAGQKSLEYYSQCLEKFFSNARSMPWFNNTVFIFCSDHWMYLDHQKAEIDLVQSFKIPIFIYDPAKPSNQTINSPVSQLDILNTVFYYTGVKDEFISYGRSLVPGIENQNRTVFAKENSSVYQAFDNTYVLSFDAIHGKTLNCYDYTKAIKRERDLAGSGLPAIDSLEMKMKAFLQACSSHYRNKN